MFLLLSLVYITTHLYRNKGYQYYDEYPYECFLFHLVCHSDGDCRLSTTITHLGEKWLHCNQISLCVAAISSSIVIGLDCLSPLHSVVFLELQPHCSSYLTWQLLTLGGWLLYSFENLALFGNQVVSHLITYHTSTDRIRSLYIYVRMVHWTYSCLLPGNGSKRQLPTNEELLW